MGYDPNWTPEQLAAFKEKRNAQLREQRAKARRRKEMLEGVKDKPKDLTSREKRKLYISYLERGLKRSQAAEEVGVKYSTVLYWRKTDANFREEERNVEEIFLDKLEDTLQTALEDRGTVRDIVDILERKRPQEWAKQDKREITHTYQFEGSDLERLGRIKELMGQVRVLRPELEMPVLDAELVD